MRRIALPMTRTEDETEMSSAHIVAASLSKCSPDYVWVASSDGRIWHINWTSGAGAENPHSVEAKKVLDVAVEAVEVNGSKVDVLLVLQRLTKSSAQILAYDSKALSRKTGKLLHTYDESPQLLRAAAGGRVIIAAAKETLHIGLLKTKKINSLGDLTYRFHSFDLPDIISCLDIRASIRPTKKGGEELHSVDVVVGCARGAIYMYADLANKFPADGSPPKVGSIQPRKYHWHRRAVHSVKWSEDGKALH